MTSLLITFNEDRIFAHLVIIPGKVSYQEIIQRLQLKGIWRYLLIGSSKTKKMILLDQEMDDISLSSLRSVMIYKTIIRPMFFYNQLADCINEIKEKTKMNENVDHVATWFNYDINEKEPIIIYMMHKKNGVWDSLEKTSHSFDEVEKAIMSQECFSTLKEAKERFYELKEYYDR